MPVLLRLVNAMDEMLHAALQELEARHVRRRRRAVRVLDSTHVELDGKTLVNFASNNYLGLSHHPAVTAAVKRAIDAGGWGSGAAPLITGYTDEHATAERELAKWKGYDDAVLLPSGYQANQAAIGAITAMAASQGKGVRFLADKLVHASLIDAMHATGAVVRVFPHNGMSKLRRLLDDTDENVLQVVVTESIFSMDGDAADLAAVAQMKREKSFVLVVDEAHATGLYGPQGCGYAAELGARNAVDLSIVTLSKALGGIGGAVCASSEWCETMVNFARAYLFSTSVPPAVAAGAVAAIGVCRDEPHRRERARALARRVRAGLNAGAGDSPIIPVILGEEAKALEAAALLLEAGMLVPAIRPPTVPRGSSRLRITVSCDHTDEEIERLVTALLEALRR